MTLRKTAIVSVLIAAVGLVMAYGRPDPDITVADPGVTVPQLREVDEAREKSETLGHYGEIVFDPMRSGLLAISALAEVEADREDRAEVFEELLGETKVLGLRNSLRMVLHEIYLEAGARDAVVKNLSQMLAENDAMLAEGFKDEEEGEEEPK